MPVSTRCLPQDFTTRLYRLATNCGAAPVACAVVRTPFFTLCPVSLWQPADKRACHAFWRTSLPQRQFFIPPLSMIHINAP